MIHMQVTQMRASIDAANHRWGGPETKDKTKKLIEALVKGDADWSSDSAKAILRNVIASTKPASR